MKIEDVDLYIAVYQVRSTLDKPSAERWTSKNRDRLEIFSQVHRRYPELNNHPDVIAGAEPIDIVMDAFLALRKSDKDKLSMMIQRILKSGKECFWHDRLGTTCSGELTLDRLVPGDRGGSYSLSNVVVACQFHNSSRRNLNVEDLLKQNGANVSEENVDSIDGVQDAS